MDRGGSPHRTKTRMPNDDAPRASKTAPNSQTTDAPLAGLLEYVRPYWAWLVLIVVLILGEVGTDLLRPWPLKFVIDYLTKADGAGIGRRVGLPPWLWGSLPRFLTFVSGSLVLIAVAEGLFSYYSTYLQTKVAGQIATAIRRRLFAHIQRLDLQFHYTRPTGELVNRLLSDVRQIESFFNDSAGSLVEVAASLIGMITVLLWMDWQLTLIAVAVGPFVYWVTASFTTVIKRTSRVQRQCEGQLAAIAQETLSAIEIVKAYSREAFSDDLFERQSADNLKATLAAAAVEAKFSPVVRALMAAGIAIVVCFGVVRVRAGILSAGDLWVFLSYLRGMRGPIRDLSKNLRALARTQVRWERVHELLEMRSPTDDARVVAPRFAGHITFTDAGFAYAAETPVLRGVTLDIPAGERVAIIGQTGAGKSTLVRLIAALHEPTCGQVAIDGHDLRTLKPDSVRQQIAFVLQDTVLFRTTLRENIAYGRLDATFDEIVAAATAARIHDFIAQLPQGYDTEVGERGATLSGGQRQRVAIARALLRDARILILDEPITGLDPETAREVWEELKTLMEGRTTVLISHQPHLALDMDRIYQLIDGRLVETPHGRDRALGVATSGR